MFKSCFPDFLKLVFEKPLIIVCLLVIVIRIIGMIAQIVEPDSSDRIKCRVKRFFGGKRIAFQLACSRGRASHGRIVPNIGRLGESDNRIGVFSQKLCLVFRKNDFVADSVFFLKRRT